MDKKIKFKGFKKLPECPGYQSWTDYGYEYDCLAPYNDMECIYCLCNYHKGGYINPETGKEETGIIAFFKYGSKNI